MNDIYVVMLTVLVIWVGIFLYLVVLDRKIARLGREVNRDER